MNRTGIAAGVAAVAFGALLWSPAETVSATQAPDARVAYRIERDGQPVGSYAVRVYETAAGEDIDSQLTIATRVGPFKVRVTHESAEGWSNKGQLRRFASETDRNGDKLAVRALPAADGRLLVEAEGKATRADANILTNNFTQTGARFNGHAEKVALMDVLSGAIRPSTIVPRGRQQIACDLGTCEARRYDIVLDETGKVSHQLWLDADGVVVRMIANTRFGIAFTYVRDHFERRAA